MGIPSIDFVRFEYPVDSFNIAQQQPAGVPEANWLPVRKGLFNIMLRVYGPEGSVATNKYVPPPIVKAQ